MNHPDIGRDEKLEILHNVFEGKLSDTLYGFLEVLIHKGRYGAIDDIFYLLYGQIQGFPQNRGWHMLPAPGRLPTDRKPG